MLDIFILKNSHMDRETRMLLDYGCFFALKNVGNNAIF